MSRSFFWRGHLVACVAVLFVPACGGTTPAASQGADAVTSDSLSAGYYELASGIDSARWINDINFHNDGTFEANLGNGVSNLSGHAFTANGTYAATSSALTLHYNQGDDVDERYQIKQSAGGKTTLQFVLDDGILDGTFELQKGDEPTTIHFDAEGDPRVDGTLTSANTILIEYAAERDQCPISASETSVFFFASVDSSNPQVELAFPPKPVNDLFRVLIDLRSVPSGHHLAIWFQDETNASGASTCTKWDSNFGKNFTFDLP